MLLGGGAGDKLIEIGQGISTLELTSVQPMDIEGGEAAVVDEGEGLGGLSEQPCNPMVSACLRYN